MTRILILCSAAALGCSENGLSGLADQTAEPVGLVAVDPPLVDFGSAASGENLYGEFTITNVGGALLEVSDVTIAQGAYTLLTEETHHFLDPEQSVTMDVSFKPLSAELSTGYAVVSSNDPYDPEVRVELQGFGLVPELQITPNPHDFGEHHIGCGDEVELTLTNVGYADLDVTGHTYSGDTASLVFDGLPDAFTLAPGDSTRTHVDYLPAVEGDHSATLTVTSNSPQGAVSAHQQGTGLAGTQHSEQITLQQDVPVDILFAVDQSCSMDDDAASLGDNFSAFIQTLGSVTSQWHIGVVTFDNGCFNHGILDASTTDYDALFQEAVVLGDDLDIADDEALLKLLDRALQQTAPGYCNEGFLRPGALLHLIVVSDEPDRSVEQASAWTWDYWVQRYQTYTAANNLARVSGVVDRDDCNEGDAGYAEAIVDTSGEYLSICTDDWAQHATQLALSSLTTANGYALAHPADEGTITVTVDGQPFTSWHYDAATNAVVFDEPMAFGATIEVTYTELVPCPD